MQLPGEIDESDADIFLGFYLLGEGKPGLNKASNAAVSECETQYTKEKVRIGKLDKDDPETKAFKEKQKILAKALPQFTKGTLEAISAFQKNDPIRGCAAIMDVCASVAPLVSALAAAGGPPGMVVGAIFSMIGQILSFFAPKSESVSSQMKKIIHALRAADVKRQIEAAHDSVTSHAIALRIAMGQAQQVLESDSPADKLADQLSVQAMQIGLLIATLNPIEGNAFTSFWDVAGWLEEEEAQSLDLWPTILMAWCQFYCDFLLTSIMLPTLANTDAVRKRFDQSTILPPYERSRLLDALTELQARAGAAMIADKSVIPTALKHLVELIPAARGHGLLVHIDPRYGKLWLATSFDQQEAFHDLKGQGKKIAVAVSENDLNVPTPTYHILHLEDAPNGRTYHGISRYPYDRAVEWTDLGSSLQGLTDIWATPGAGADKDEIYFHATKGKGISSHILYKEKNQFKVKSGDYALGLKANAISVRVVRNVSWREGDPDVDRGSLQSPPPYITYGGCEASADIYVESPGLEAGYVPSPWLKYRGLGVDQHYLWVFGSGGFACATHASVIRCWKGKIAKPRWVEHRPDDLLYDSKYWQLEKHVVNRTELRGLLDLSPCDDGTLVAAISQRSVDHRWLPAGGGMATDWYEFVDQADPPLYTGTYEIDLKEPRKITVTWKRLPEGIAGVGVQKLPVSCWSMLEGLAETLPALAPVLRTSSASRLSDSRQ